MPIYECISLKCSSSPHAASERNGAPLHRLVEDRLVDQKRSRSPNRLSQYSEPAEKRPKERGDGKGAVSERLVGQDAATEDDGNPTSGRDGPPAAVIVAAAALLTMMPWAILIWIALTVL
jgi:hypothetical protein